MLSERGAIIEKEQQRLLLSSHATDTAVREVLGARSEQQLQMIVAIGMGEISRWSLLCSDWVRRMGTRPHHDQRLLRELAARVQALSDHVQAASDNGIHVLFYD